MKVFKGSVTFLLIGVIAIMTFISKPTQELVMIGFFGAWGIFNLIRLIRWLKRKPKTRKNKTEKVKRIKKEKKSENKIIPDFFKPSSDEPEYTDDLISALTRYANCRISDKLKSAYPDATWSWNGTYPVAMMIDGGTGRINTANTNEFNQADVTLDKFGRISFTMLKAEPMSNGNPGAATPAPVVDVSMWYSLMGRKVINNIVTELNTHGHQSLHIKDNGDIVTGSGNSETRHDTMENFPKSSTWTELVKAFAGDGLTADIDNSRIKISW